MKLPLSPQSSKTLLPEIDLASQPPVKDISESALLTEGAQQFLKQGVLLVKNAFDASYIQTLHKEYMEKYRKYLVDEAEQNPQDFGNALKVGHKRVMIPLDLTGSYNSEQFYANEGLLPLLKFLLGKTMIVNSLGSVFSLPGSEDQHIHRDMPNVYVTETNKGNDDGWLAHAPPYAITVGIPLIPITELTGNTRFWPGTHHTTIETNDPNLGKGVDFTCDIGSCVLFDYRIIHTGVANKSDQIRPLLYSVYSRDWFRDSVNYKKHEPLNMSVEQLAMIPNRYQSLFAWAVKGVLEPAAVQNREIGRNDPCFCHSGKKYKQCHGKLT